MFDREVDYRVVWPTYRIRLHGPGDYYHWFCNRMDPVPNEVDYPDYHSLVARIDRISTAWKKIDSLKVPAWVTYKDVVFQVRTNWHIHAVSRQVDIKGTILYNVINTDTQHIGCGDTLTISDMRFECD